MGVDPNQQASASGASASATGLANTSTNININTRSRKRKTAALDRYGDSVGGGGGYTAGEAGDVNTAAQPAGSKKKREEDKKTTSKSEPAASAPSPKAAGGEKRLRRYRERPPAAFAAILERATTQRFFVLSRTLCGTHDCPELYLQVSGSTGNVYNVCIAQQPTCDCPHAKAGNQCKHVIFVLKKVLRARYHYVYQLALLSTELKDILENAPDPADAPAGLGHHDKNRKPVEGDCPICFEEMEMDTGKEQLVWCKAACGQNIHRQCFEMWAATKRQAAGTTAKVSCPYCRSVWEGDDEIMKTIDVRRGKLTDEGYHNVADQLGVSTQRDYSTYSHWWSGHPDRRGRSSYW